MANFRGICSWESWYHPKLSKASIQNQHDNLQVFRNFQTWVANLRAFKMFFDFKNLRLFWLVTKASKEHSAAGCPAVESRAAASRQKHLVSPDRTRSRNTIQSHNRYIYGLGSASSELHLFFTSNLICFFPLFFHVFSCFSIFFFCWPPKKWRWPCSPPAATPPSRQGLPPDSWTGLVSSQNLQTQSPCKRASLMTYKYGI